MAFISSLPTRDEFAVWTKDKRANTPEQLHFGAHAVRALLDLFNLLTRVVNGVQVGVLTAQQRHAPPPILRVVPPLLFPVVTSGVV